ncbi:MFS transporter [Luteimonas sp. e5]
MSKIQRSPTTHSQFGLLRQRRFLPYFIVQCLGAFNDNVYRQAVIGLLFFMGVSLDERTLYTNLAPAIFILPYFLFSAHAGQIAEKLEKSRLIRITTGMEIAIMSLAAVGFVLQSMPILLLALFATGMQSTLFGPVKYSILPAILRREELTGGNGLVEMGTSVSILAGMLTGGGIFLLAGQAGPHAAAAAIVLLAVLGRWVAGRIPPVPAGDPELRIKWNPLRESLNVWRLTRHQPAVRNAVLGVSWFWFIGTMLTAQLPTWAEVQLGGRQELYLLALALFSIGTGTGSLLCEKLSGRRVELGLVPLGAFGVSAFLLDLYFARSGESLLQGLSIDQFVTAPGSLRIIIDLLGVGVFTGFFVVPLFALIQSRTPSNEMARVIAGLNIQNALFIVIAAGTGIVLQQVLGWSIPQVFLGLAIANALVAIYIFSIVPEFAMRFVAWLLTSLLYRVRREGVEQAVPDEGAALIVCNHVSYMDALILSGAIKRPVRFVMYYRIFNIPLLSWMFRTARAIPIAGVREDADLMQRAFDQIDAALAAGELVCIFPEGALTRDGEIAPFKTGVEKALQRAARRGQTVPVIPLALRGMWASMWSRRNARAEAGRLGRMRLPRRLRARVEVIAGPPLDGREATAARLEDTVRALRGKAA